MKEAILVPQSHDDARGKRVTVATRSTIGHRDGGMESFIHDQLCFLRARHFSVTLLTTDGVSNEYRDFLESHQIELMTIEGSSSTAYDATWHQKVAVHLARSSADIAIFHGVAGLRCRPDTIRMITLTHGSFLLSLYNSSLGNSRLRSILSRLRTFVVYREAFALRRHELVALSRFDARLTALSTFQSRRNIRVIPPSVRGNPTAAVRLNWVVYVGRVERLKGVDVILQAWDSIDTNDFTLLVVGDGSHLPELQRRFRNTPNVEFLGRRSHSEVRSLLSRARWSVGAGQVMESFGLAAAESLAVGTPVIYPRRGALPETVSAGGMDYSDDPAACLRTAVNMKEQEWVNWHSRAIAQAKVHEPATYERAWDTILGIGG